MSSPVRLLTFHAAPNYGAVLQAYALQRAVQGLGIAASFIDYRPAYLTSGGPFHWPVSRRALRANAVIAYQKLNCLKGWLTGSVIDEEFETFVREHLVVEGPRYRSLRQLRAEPPSGGVYLCGSDQIWNAPAQFGLDPAFLLDFGTDETRRLAYAASFGRPFLDAHYHESFRHSASRLDGLAVRERSAVDLVRELTGREALWVPDPTLLNTDYPEAQMPGERPPYLFAYVLRSKETALEVQRLVSRNMGLEIVTSVSSHQRWEALGEAVSPGPFAWMGYIRASRFSVTNSFHGLLFSIIFRRPFIFVGLGGEKAAFNERALSLLERLGLQDRLISSCDPARVEALCHEVIDWDRVHGEIAIWRAEALDYLRAELNAAGIMTF